MQYLVAHVVGGNRFAVAVLDGTSATDAIRDVVSTPQLGADPVHAWATSAATQVEAFTRPGALDRPVDHPLGPITGRDFLGFRILDVTLHAWDLACAIGGDDALPDALVALVLEIVGAGPSGMGFGINPLPWAPNAPPLARLLALTGRSGSDVDATS